MTIITTRQQSSTPTPASGTSSVDRARLDALGPQYARFLPAIERAAAKYNVPPEVLIGILKRETNGQLINGDGGHGRGPWQIDDRSHGAWLRSHDAMDIEQSTDYAASVLRNSINAKGGDLRAGIAGYNCGPGNVHPPDYDSRTTGHDYSADVLSTANYLNGGPLPAGAGVVRTPGSEGSLSGSFTGGSMRGAGSRVPYLSGDARQVYSDPANQGLFGDSSFTLDNDISEEMLLKLLALLMGGDEEELKRNPELRKKLLDTMLKANHLELNAAGGLNAGSEIKVPSDQFVRPSSADKVPVIGDTRSQVRSAAPVERLSAGTIRV